MYVTQRFGMAFAASENQLRLVLMSTRSEHTVRIYCILYERFKFKVGN